MKDYKDVFLGHSNNLDLPVRQDSPSLVERETDPELPVKKFKTIF